MLLACLLALCVTLASSPFTKEKPKRVFIQHVRREFLDDSGRAPDEGLWLNCMDARCFQDLRIPELKQTLPDFFRASHSRQGLLDDMPWYLPIAEAIDHGIYAPAKSPLPEGNDLTFEARSTSISSADSKATRSISFLGKGPTHMTMVINASSAPLVKWPWTDTIPSPRPECNCWFVYFATGSPGSKWEFELLVAGTDPLRVTFYGHHFNEWRQTSPDIEGMKAKLPEWVSPVAFVSQWKNWAG